MNNGFHVNQPPGTRPRHAPQFVIHECPQATIRDFVRESARVLRPRGVLCFVDNNPKCVGAFAIRSSVLLGWGRGSVLDCRPPQLSSAVLSWPPRLLATPL